MSGFGKFTVISEFFNQSIVNILWYRSQDLVWDQGNVFENAQSVTDTVADLLTPLYRGAMLSNSTLLRFECTPYNDAMEPLIGSPLIRTVNLPGLLTGEDTVGAATCAIIGLKCSQQVQIRGVGHSLRNRGYIAFGPMSEGWVDDYSHIQANYVDTKLKPLADGLIRKIESLIPLAELTPIRVHSKKIIGPLEWMTYSDVVGYTLPRVVSFRRSRVPEA